MCRTLPDEHEPERPTMTAGIEFWDQIAEKYARSPVKNVEAYEQTLERTASYLSPRDAVLELGCGTGTTALKLGRFVQHYTGSDISKTMINIAEGKAEDQGAGNVDFLAADASGEVFEEGFYAAVLAFNLIHLLDDAEGMLGRAYDLLEPGGMFISKTPCIGERSALWRPVIGLMQFFGKAPYLRYVDTKGLEAMIEAAGFSILESRTFNNAGSSRFIAARKPSQ